MNVDLFGRRSSIVSKKDYASWLNFVENSFTKHLKPQKLLEKSKSLELNPREFRSYYNRIKKCSIKIYSEEFNFVEKFFTTHVNPRKLLEKSGTKIQGIPVLIPSDQ
jgi:hypothetical protein